jgi:ABC-type transporter Mla maintaining outer membrane lipid asymmetry permease subunit MlaE
MHVACSATAVGGVDDAQDPLRVLSPSLAAWATDLHPPRFVWRSMATMLLAGQVAWRLCTGKVNLEQLQDQIGRIGPATMSVAMLTASFVGMVRCQHTDPHQQSKGTAPCPPVPTF